MCDYFLPLSPYDQLRRRFHDQANRLQVELGIVSMLESALRDIERHPGLALMLATSALGELRLLRAKAPALSLERVAGTG